MAPEDTVNPYRNFPIRIVWKDRVVAAFTRMRGLENGAAVTFEQGVSHDGGFEQWASSSQEPQEIVVDLVEEMRMVRLRRCVVATYESTPAGDHDVTIARLGLLNEGWEEVRSQD